MSSRTVPSGSAPPRSACFRRAVIGAAAVAGGAVAVWALRAFVVRPSVVGVDDLPGDDLLPDADLVATRAIEIDAGPEDVWGWIAQLGQNKGGFYSYQRLENMFGCTITNADYVIPQWQHPRVGDEVRMAPKVALQIAEIERARHLVLLAGVGGNVGLPPVGEAPAPVPYDFTWSFVVEPAGQGRSRLLVRERYRYHRGAAALIVEPISMVSSVMSRKMLRGIKCRAEGRHLRSR